MPPESPVRRARVSLRDVAREVGVSHVTVSLALRHDPRISLERRQEVEAAAKRLGYRPDPMLSSLSAYRQAKLPVTIRSTVAWLNQWDDPKALRRLHEFDNYWRGARETAERLGYRLEEFVLKRDLSAARLQKILTTRNVRGILIPPHPTGLNLPDFDWSFFSIVRFGASVKVPRAHIVTSDQTKCAAMAFTRVHERGYGRIGYVSSLRFDRDTKGNFRAGYLSCQDALLPVRRHLPDLFLEETPTSREVRNLRKWLRTAAPDAIITTLSCLPELLMEAGWRVPDDIAVATLSVADGHFDSGVDQDSFEIGQVAMSTVAGLIHQNERGIPEHCRRILVEGQWVDGRKRRANRPGDAAGTNPCEISAAVATRLISNGARFPGFQCNCDRIWREATVGISRLPRLIAAFDPCCCDVPFIPLPIAMSRAAGPPARRRRSQWSGSDRPVNTHPLTHEYSRTVFHVAQSGPAGSRAGQSRRGGQTV
jgi:LacI family transcriptional regulator